jgi:hypothetical protein
MTMPRMPTAAGVAGRRGIRHNSMGGAPISMRPAL